jgi:hypothetical protein
MKKYWTIKNNKWVRTMAAEALNFKNEIELYDDNLNPCGYGRF